MLCNLVLYIIIGRIFSQHIHHHMLHSSQHTLWRDKKKYGFAANELKGETSIILHTNEIMLIIVQRHKDFWVCRCMKVHK